MAVIYSTYGAIVRSSESNRQFIGNPDLVPCGSWNIGDIKIDKRYLYVGTEGNPSGRHAGAHAASTVDLSNADLIEIQTRIPHNGYYYYEPFRLICNLMDTEEQVKGAFITISYSWQSKKILISYYSNQTTIMQGTFDINYNPDITNLKVDTHTWDFTLTTTRLKSEIITNTFTGRFSNPVNLSTKFPLGIGTISNNSGDGVGIKIDYTDTFIKINNKLAWGCQRTDGT